MAQKPLVSILVPCYNSAPWLAETLDSALTQTYSDIELIVVDDGSEDDSLAIAKSYESKHVKVISQQNRGASAARNVAYKSSKGEYIQYLDADDIISPDKIERQIIHLKNRPDCLAAGEWGRFYVNVHDAIFLKEPVWDNSDPVSWLVSSWTGGGMMHPASWLIPRKIAARAGYWNELLSLNDDGEYFSRVLLASQGVTFCWGAKSYYRSGLSDSLSKRRSKKAIESALYSIELCTQNLLAIEDNLKTRHACATAFQRFVYSTYPNAPGLVAKAEAKVKELGGTQLLCSGGLRFRIMAQLTGWKLARRIQNFASGYG